MGLQIQPQYFSFDDGSQLPVNSVYSCCSCLTHITSQSEIISAAYQGKLGPAYLVNQAINVILGRKEERMLMTGIHTVADLFCIVCHMRIGWLYVKSPTRQQEFKEGRYVIEKTRVIQEKYYKYSIDT